MMSEHGHPVDPERVETARTGAFPAADASAVAGLLAVLGDPLRMRILTALRLTDEMCVGDLAVALDASEDAVSYALRLLRGAGLVRRRREGRLRYYRLRDGAASDLMAESLRQLRELTAMHPELTADDTNDETA